MSLEELFPELYSDSVKQMSLSLMYEGMGVEKGFTVSVYNVYNMYGCTVLMGFYINFRYLLNQWRCIHSCLEDRIISKSFSIRYIL